MIKIKNFKLQNTDQDEVLTPEPVEPEIETPDTEEEELETPAEEEEE